MAQDPGTTRAAHVRFTQELPGHRHSCAMRRVDHQKSIPSDNIVAGNYSIGKKLGEGSFGVIYQGVNVLTKEPVAIKFESRKTDAPQLGEEYKFYRMINPSFGFPICHYFGREGAYNLLCIDLLGPSLEDLFDLCGRKFSVKTVCMVAKQMISRIQKVHEYGYIYRDIKPDNFLIGCVKNSKVQDSRKLHIPHDVDSKFATYYQSLTEPILARHSRENPHPSSLIYAVDFGMTKRYMDPYTHTHVPYREKKSLSGTARYMSINTHLGREQSRRDDLEALGHVFMYLLRGSLPWQGLRGTSNKQKYEKIGGKKQCTLIRSLCAGYPKEFEVYLTYARSLKFDESPNYKYLIGLFDSALSKIDEADDGVFDWMIEMDRQVERLRLRETAWKRKDERYYDKSFKTWRTYHNPQTFPQYPPNLRESQRNPQQKTRKSPRIVQQKNSASPSGLQTSTESPKKSARPAPLSSPSACCENHTSEHCNSQSANERKNSWGGINHASQAHSEKCTQDTHTPFSKDLHNEHKSDHANQNTTSQIARKQPGTTQKIEDRGTYKTLAYGVCGQTRDACPQDNNACPKDHLCPQDNNACSQDNNACLQDNNACLQDNNACSQDHLCPQDRNISDQDHGSVHQDNLKPLSKVKSLKKKIKRLFCKGS